MSCEVYNGALPGDAVGAWGCGEAGEDAKHMLGDAIVSKWVLLLSLGFLVPVGDAGPDIGHDRNHTRDSMTRPQLLGLLLIALLINGTRVTSCPIRILFPEIERTRDLCTRCLY